MENRKFKIYRSKKNRKLDGLINTVAVIWNHCVSLNRRFYRRFKKGVPEGRMLKQFAKLRKTNGYFKNLNSQTVQEVVQRFYKSQKRFFDKTQKRLPKVKKWKHVSSLVLKQAGYKIEGNTIIINGIKTSFRFHKSREFGTVRRVSISRNRAGDFFIIICSDNHPKDKHYGKTLTGASVGLDFGLKTFLTHSDGKTTKAPLFYHQMKSQIRTAHKRFSKSQKGSKKRTQKAKQLARLYRKLVNKRTDHQWKLSHDLCREYDNIYIETLNLEGMKKLWGRKISDLCHGNFCIKLAHIASKTGTGLHKIDKWYPSSKTCHVCLEVNKDLQLCNREWTCKGCGTTHDRDLNAAKNIIRQGIVEGGATVRQIPKKVCGSL